MRFTKIPLIATLMAVALSLLIVLPGLAQSQNYDDTRGRLYGGANLRVDVLKTVGAEPTDLTPTPLFGALVTGDELADSYFNGNLYVSNAGTYSEAGARTGGAYNEVRIRANTAIKQTEFAGADGVLANVLNADGTAPITAETSDATNEGNYANDNFACDAVATVRNNNSGRSIKVYMNDPATASDITNGTTAGVGSGLPAGRDGTVVPMHAVFEVISSGDEKRDGYCASPVRNSGGGSSSRTSDGADPPVYTDDTLAASVNEVRGRIPARHGDTLTITVAGVAGSVTIVVDADGPEFSEISPEHKAYVSSNTVKFRFVVTDTDSGLAHDGELDYSRGDQDARAYNTDGDGNITTEPRSDADGSARDIKVVVGSDKSASGSNGWRVRPTGGRPGVSYFLDMAVTGLEPGNNDWHLTAKDRAGNSTQTDADPNKSGKDDFELIVDVSSPEFREARTGISYDAAKKTEVANRSYIAVTFEDASGLDAVTSVDHSKFLVEDAEVVDAIHLADKSDCNNDDSADDQPLDIDGRCLGTDDKPQSRVYLQLAEPLAPDAKPQVSMFGGAVLDLAGNPSNQHEIDAEDNIAPAITVTLTTVVGDRPVIRSNAEVDISITSDEDLRRLPTVFFSKIVDGGSTAEKPKAVLGAMRRGDRVRTDSGAENSWSRTYNNGDVGGSDGLYAVIVIAEDDADNIGSTPGWGHLRSENTPQAAVNSGSRTVKLGDLEAAGLLVEIDTELGAPTFSLAPETGDDTRTTESDSPFITIDFKTEKGEYGDYVYKAGSAPAGKSDGDKISNFGDSHSAVAITSITLNGDDVMDQTTRVSSSTRTYTLAAQDLATGDYELKVTGRDDAGNEATGTYEFEVAARKPYKLDLTPGWNLVSLPGTPLDSSVGSVMGDSMQSSIVLAYQDDQWLTAVNDQGTWRGTLTDIVGGYGYWVQTTAFESISTLIPETDTSSVLPTAKVIAGWNLLGVVDVLQAGPGKAPSGGSDPDDYFGNIAWKVAYSFDTSDNTWAKSIPGSGTTGIANGKGYWVWSTKAGTLVP